MSTLDLSIWLLTLPGLALGAWSIYWARLGASPTRVLLGRRLFLAALLGLGATALVGAMANSMSLAPTAIVSVFLVVAMLWEGPVAA